MGGEDKVLMGGSGEGGEMMLSMSSSRSKPLTCGAALVPSSSRRRCPNNPKLVQEVQFMLAPPQTPPQAPPHPKIATPRRGRNSRARLWDRK